jgi:hypothetical protein
MSTLKRRSPKNLEFSRQWVEGRNILRSSERQVCHGASAERLVRYSFLGLAMSRDWDDATEPGELYAVQRQCPARTDRKRETECWRGCAADRCERMVEIGLDDAGRPRPYLDRPLCGAITRKLFSCYRRVIPGKTRCRLHGGMSTGPKSLEGRQRIAEAQRLRWQRFWAAKRGVGQ